MGMSRRKARRNWERWLRYYKNFMGEQYVASGGLMRAYDALIRTQPWQGDPEEMRAWRRAHGRTG